MFHCNNILIYWNDELYNSRVYVKELFLQYFKINLNILVHVLVYYLLPHKLTYKTNMQTQWHAIISMCFLCIWSHLRLLAISILSGFTCTDMSGDQLVCHDLGQPCLGFHMSHVLQQVSRIMFSGQSQKHKSKHKNSRSLQVQVWKRHAAVSSLLH